VRKQLPLEHCDLNVNHAVDIHRAAPSKGTMLRSVRASFSKFWYSLALSGAMRCGGLYLFASLCGFREILLGIHLH